MLLGQMSPSQACCGAGARQGRWGAVYTRGHGGWRGQHGSLSQCGPPGPQVLALEVGEEGPETGGSRLTAEAGGPTVRSVPGKGEVLGLPTRGTGPKESDGTLLPAWGPRLRCLPGDSSASARAEPCVSDLGPVVFPDG